MRRAALLLLLATGLSAARTADVAGAPPDTPANDVEAVAIEARAVVARRDAPGLERLARRDDPDPWLVADALLAGGTAEAATAFARSAPRKDVEGLAAAVAAAVAAPVPPVRRAALTRRLDALRSGKFEEAAQPVGPDEAVDPSDLLTARALFARAKALQELRRFEESAEAFDRGAAAAERIGWHAGRAQCFEQGARSRFRRADYAGALERARNWLAVEEALGVETGRARASSMIVTGLQSLSRDAEAREWLDRAFAAADRAGDPSTQAACLQNQSYARFLEGRYEEALVLARDALDRLSRQAAWVPPAARFHDDPRLVVQTRGSLGLHAAACAQRLGRMAEALAFLAAGREAAERGGSPSWAGRAVATAGSFRHLEGNRLGAIKDYEEALALYERGGDRDGLASVLRSLGVARTEIGDHPGALAALRRALELHRAVGNVREVVQTRLGLVDVLVRLGESEEALAEARRALEEARAIPDAILEAGAEERRASVHYVRGELGQALEAYGLAISIARSHGIASRVGECLLGVGRVQESVGDSDRAREAAEEAQKLATSAADRDLEGRALLALAVNAYQRDEGGKAQASLTAARPLFEARHDDVNLSHTLRLEGVVRHVGGEYAAAAELAHASVRAAERARRPDLAARARLNRSNALVALGKNDEAVKELDAAVADGERSGDFEARGRALWGRANARLALGRPRDAVVDARSALDALSVLGRDLGEGESALVREPYASLVETGLGAAQGAGDLAAFLQFLEEGRAKALRAALGGREALRGAAVPAPLRHAEAVARATEALAFAQYRAALDADDLLQIRQQRKALEVARREVRDAVTGIQRQARARTSVAYPAPVGLPGARSQLGPTEAMVLYGMTRDRAYALLLRSQDARVVDLGPRAAVEGAARALVPLEPPYYVDPDRIDAARRLLVTPLALPPDVRLLLVSPVGPLATLPFRLLVGDLNLAFVPSATIHGVLREDHAPHGAKILALGDPDYETVAGAPRPPLALAGRGRLGQLVRLVSTRGEVESIGDSVFLGGEASETRLRATLGVRDRWRAIHLACHGLIDTDGPLLSALALTADDQNDGFLTALDVYQLDVRADLVCLSACETGRARVVQGEGVLGFAGAFLCAGTPRVLCSLWKVDDVATRTLMERFYALWNPKDGSKGMGTAAALRAAQDYVRTHEIEVEDAEATKREGHPVTKRERHWEHPYYWAAWVLWGLAD